MPWLTAIVPLQLSLAGTAEVGAGYDSTAVDPRRNDYVDAALLRPALDLMAMHRGERVLQYLRNRAEAMYEATGGRDVLDSDVFNVTRYGLVWRLGETVTLDTDASYAIGAPALFFSRAGRPDVSFARRGLAFRRQLVADYLVQQSLTVRVRENDALSLDGALAGRYPVTSQPRGQNVFTPYVAGRWTHDFNEDNTGVLGARVEYLSLELFRPVWSTQAWLGWGRNWDEDTNTLIEAGGAAIQSNVGQERWDLQPFFRGRVFRRFERLQLVVGASYAHTFGVVSATLGTGAIDLVSATAFWRPGFGRGVYFADAGLQRGEGFDPASARPVNAVFAGAGVGARYTFTPALRIFARYDFQWEHSDAYVAAGRPDFVRHVVIVGLQFALATDEDSMAALVPVDEAQALDHVRRGAGAAPLRTLDPQGDLHERSRRRRERLPGDPSDDEIEREERARGAGGDEPPLPGEDARLPGENDTPAGQDNDEERR